MWLVVAAIPLQGLAAATMLACGGGPLAPPSAGAAGDGHLDHQHAVYDAAAAQAADQPAGPDHVSAHSMHKCSVCAACCAAAALPASVVDFESAVLTEHFATLAPRSIVAFAATGPERPPRPILA